jgi:hypothetical protein
MYSIGEFAALISEKQNWRKLIMKNLMRMLAVVMLLTGASLARTAEPAPGPQPPVQLNILR